MRSCLAALALSVIVKHGYSLHKNYEKSGLQERSSSHSPLHVPGVSRAVLRSEIKQKMFQLSHNSSHLKNIRRMKNNPQRNESLEQTLLDAITYLNKTRETAVRQMQGRSAPKGCKMMCMVASIVNILALLLSTTGWMSCPMLFALLPLWWSTGMITLMVDEGMDFSMANFMLNQIVTTIGYGSTPSKGERGLQLFDALMSLTSGLLIQPTMYLLIDQSMDFFDDHFWGMFNKNTVFAKFVDMLLWLTLETMILAGKGDDVNLARAFNVAVITATTIGYGDIDPSASVFGENALGLIGHHLISPFLTQAMARFQSDLTTKLKHGPTFKKKPKDADPENADLEKKSLKGNFNTGECKPVKAPSAGGEAPSAGGEGGGGESDGESG